ncbi:hypothetical protein BC938DRAFT_484154 [Jimgerdemannia flammicorona]|uniref:BTB domain-containing protein n=1 Tax=Jimgerdemannia flammicorona TaxID=994334 RepID=A0A433QVB4_9FUNG|nr:hypothetical protein BC938DRAFT_484154 [Jimgerdemannia flammicorona]
MASVIIDPGLGVKKNLLKRAGGAGIRYCLCNCQGTQGIYLAANRLPDPDDKLFVGCRIKSPHDRRYFLPPTITAALSSQCNNHRTADVEFRIGPEAKSLYGHRYFAVMFGSGLRESNDDGSRTVIDVPDIEHPVFEALLQHIYLDQTEFDNDVRMPDLLLTADKYDVLELTKIVWDHVAAALTPGGVCQLLMVHGHIRSIKKNMIIYLVNQFNEVEKTEDCWRTRIGL